MVWLYRSPIQVGRRGVISLFKLFLPAFATRRGRGVGGGGRHPVGERHRCKEYPSHIYTHRVHIGIRVEIGVVCSTEYIFLLTGLVYLTTQLYTATLGDGRAPPTLTSLG
jgi:hypothetical protein